MKYPLSSLIKIVALIACAVNYSVGQECSYSGTQNLRTKVSNTYNTMMEDFDFECRISNDCVSTSSPFTTKTTRNYSNLGEIGTPINFYNQYVQFCEQAGMSICLISATQVISIPGQAALNISPGYLIVDDIDKPLCFPNTCSESQFEDLNPYDKQCQFAIAAGEACAITEKSATCPESKFTNKDTFMCSNQNPGPFTQIQLMKNALYTLMDAQCTEATAIGGNAYCEVQNEAEERTNTASYTAFINESASYSNYEQDCLNNNGATCNIDFQLKFIPFLPAGATIFYDYTGYPICIPNTCSSDTESLVREYIFYDIRNTFDSPLCDELTGTCELELTNLSCSDFISQDIIPQDDITSIPNQENNEDISEVDISLNEESSESEVINEQNDTTSLEPSVNEVDENPRDTSSASLWSLSYWFILFSSFLFV